ncbi:MAG: tRNA uridine-5-carboxymethylaminomethyl(34) synthesis GTPase MnmE [Halieaceae bacterium]
MTEYAQLADDTIAAIATAPGRGGIGIIRLSGPKALTIGEAICQKQLEGRQASFSAFTDPQTDDALDTGIALFFPAPHSFTGEDVVELQGHGGPVVLDLLLRLCCQQGARLATAGEFSQRAFLNDKLDLAQAEAVADLINASTESAARSANRSLQGAFSSAIETLLGQVLSLRIFVEAAIDFPEEEIDFIEEGQVLDKLEAISTQLKQVMATARQGSLLRDGMKLVIAGRPNAGKSSLLNALSGQESAIVTPIEGTTRDVLREHIQIDGMPLHIVDTAGLRDSVDPIEQEGIKRAWEEMQSADRILLVVDDCDQSDRDKDSDSIWPELQQQLSASIPVTIIHNKCDLSGNSPASEDRDDSSIVTLSAKTGAGMDLLSDHLKQAMGFEADSEQTFIARRRHLLALQQAAGALEQGSRQIKEQGAGELLAEDLRLCHDYLGTITGAMHNDELLGEIFSSFCIGK